MPRIPPDVEIVFMPKDFLQGAREHYDVVVIGSGLAGLTSANILARQGYSVLLLEHHYQLGGMATWFKRTRGHIFDISLHGFPVGMIKSCRKYWTQEIADSIVPLTGIRFENPQFSLRTTFTREDFTRIMIEHFRIEPEKVRQFFDVARSMNFYDEQARTTRHNLPRAASSTIRSRQGALIKAARRPRPTFGAGPGSRSWRPPRRPCAITHP